MFDITTDPIPILVMAGLPKPYGVSEKPNDSRSGALTQNESSIILQTTLLPEHRSDPTIVAWIASYIRCRNAAQACREVGIDERSGYNLRNRPDIHLAITKLTEKSLMKYGYDATEIVERVKEISALDPIYLQNEDGSFKTNFHQIPPEVRRAIKKLKVKNIWDTDANGIRVQTGEIIDYEFYDKMDAHKILGQEKDVFKQTTRVEHDVGKNMASVLLESARRGGDVALEITGRVVDGEEVTDG